MKSKSPAFQFYYKEWLTGTRGMSRIEKDIYLTLLIYQFDFRNKLPNDFQELKRICEIKSKKEISSLNYILEKKFLIEGEFLLNKKMKCVIENLDNYILKQKENGSNGGRPKKAVGLFGLQKEEPKITSTTTTTTTTETNNNVRDNKSHANKFWNTATQKESALRTLTNNQLPSTEENLKKLMGIFLTEITAKGENKYYKDFCAHFISWIGTKGNKFSDKFKPEDANLKSESTYETKLPKDR